MGVVLLTGCLQARASVIHPTGDTRTESGASATSIARTTSGEQPEPTAAQRDPDFSSVEINALVPLSSSHDSVRFHLAPGLRILGSQPKTPMFGLAVGADFERGFALESSVYVGNANDDTKVVEQSLDLFAGVTLDSAMMHSSIAIGPSAGILAMPGGHSELMIGLGLRFQHERPWR